MKRVSTTTNFDSTEEVKKFALKFLENNEQEIEITSNRGIQMFEQNAGVLYRIEKVHISQIMPGDTIIHSDGLVRTVNFENIKTGKFMGTTLFGDSYRLGTQKVKRILFY